MKDRTAFPHLTLLMDVEQVLADALEQRGVPVERGAEVVDAWTRGDAAHATLETGGSREGVTCRFVAACDGPDSTVRRATGISWRGGVYREEGVVLADAELDGDLAHGVHVVAARPGLVFLFALGEGAMGRILATRPTGKSGDAFGTPGPEIPPAEVQRLLDAAGLPITGTEVKWSGRVRLQHRLADSFRQGRILLAGDAAYTHSQAAAQGMNTGILDAVNLAWKPAYAAGHGSHADLLASYELERRPVARRVLALTHAVFFAEASSHPLPAFARGTLVPLAAPVVPLLLGRRRLMGGGPVAL